MSVRVTTLVLVSQGLLDTPSDFLHPFVYLQTKCDETVTEKVVPVVDSVKRTLTDPKS